MWNKVSLYQIECTARFTWVSTMPITYIRISVSIHRVVCCHSAIPVSDLRGWFTQGYVLYEV